MVDGMLDELGEAIVAEALLMKKEELDKKYKAAEQESKTQLYKGSKD